MTESRDERIRTTSGSRARDHLANERTWLAWVRTAVGLVVLGAAVARFSPNQGARNDAAAALIVITLLGAMTASMMNDGRFPMPGQSRAQTFSYVGSTIQPSSAASPLEGATNSITVLPTDRTNEDP